MYAVLGHDADARKLNRDEPVVWDSELVANPHIALLGMSGAGKSHTIRNLVSGMASSAKEKIVCHLFDLAGDMATPGASSVLFSEQTPYGLNPLRVCADPHYGGLRNRIRTFIQIINEVSSTPLGIKQQTVIRHLLQDVYASHGFKLDEPSTWFVDPTKEVLVNAGARNRLYLDIPKQERFNAKEVAGEGVLTWDNDYTCWWIKPENYKGPITNWKPRTVGRTHPTVEDVLRHANLIHRMSFLGSDQKAVMHLEAFYKAAASYNRKVLEQARRGVPSWEDSNLSDTLDALGQRAVVTFADHVEAVRTGVELDNLLKYDSTDVLKSVIDRLELLVGTGLFKSAPMPFDPRATVWHYQLNPLSNEYQLMFALFRLDELWTAARQRGPSDEIREVYILDEFGRYATATKDQDNIINILARESRKYGVALVIAGQDSDSLPEGLVRAFGTKIILGVDESQWKSLTNKMRISDQMLQGIKLKKTIAVQFKETGATKNEWRSVSVSQEKNLLCA